MQHFISKALFLLGFSCAIAASAQSISVGVIGGAPFTDVVEAKNQNNLAFLPKSTNFVLGPSFQVSLPLSLRIEVDALYRPYQFTATSTLPAPLAAAIAPLNLSASQWSFPVLAQYRFKLPVVKPFVEGGVSFDHLSGVSSLAKTYFTSGPGQFLQTSHAGVVLGGGIDVKVPFVRVSGELRYTHQGSADFRDLSKLNQAEVLIGLHF